MRYHQICQHIRYIGVTEEKEMKKGEETIFEKIMGRISKSEERHKYTHSGI